MYGSMRIRLVKSWRMNERRNYPVGTILQVTNDLGANLIKSKKGELYEGEYPPQDKQKINLTHLKTE